MNVSEFSEASKQLLDQLLQWYQVEIAKGTIKLETKGNQDLNATCAQYYFPSILRIIETPDHFIAELAGCTNNFPDHGLIVEREEKWQSATSYFNPGFPFNTSEEKNQISNNGLTLKNICLVNQFDREAFSKKLGIPLPECIIGQGTSAPIAFSSTANRTTMSNVVIIRGNGSMVLFRNIMAAFLVIKSDKIEEYADWLIKILKRQIDEFRNPIGLVVGYKQKSAALAQQLRSFADQAVNEPVIDRFIQRHAAEFAKALGYTNVLSQRTLKWKKQLNPEIQESKPDYLLRRSDGHFDILDLKRTLLERPITKGPPERLRFTDKVSELVAQLRMYEQYFDFEENRSWAKDKYGVTVKEPRLIGIIGNYDTNNPEEVSQAQRCCPPNLTIMDYSSLANLVSTISD